MKSELLLIMPLELSVQERVNSQRAQQKCVLEFGETGLMSGVQI